MSNSSHTIDGEQAYIIYRIAVKWIQDGDHSASHKPGHAGLPDGRIWNASGYHKMYREDPGKQAAIEDAQEWWRGYSADKLDGMHPGRPRIWIERVWYETWCLGWFNHHTFDDGRSDRELIESFERYVRRYEHMQGWSVSQIIENENYICLMGAEDRWRWHGEPPPEDRNPAPCRCQHCQELGFVRIGH